MLTFRNVWRPRQESNLYLALRRRSFYPLNYGGVEWILGAGVADRRAYPRATRLYFDNIRIASSSPLRVSGNMRLPVNCWMMLMLCRYCHTPWGSGLIQTNLG